MSRTVPDPLLRLARRFARPPELVARTRWLFLLCVLGSLATTAPAVPGAGPWSLPLLAVSSAAFLVSWFHRYLTQRTLLALDVSDVVATVLFALACPQPAIAFGVTFPALWFRAVYGRSWHVTTYAIGLTLAVAASVWCWTWVPGHDSPAPAAAALGALPVMLLTALVVRHLVVGLFARDHARARDAALARLGSQLLGVTDVAQIRLRGWEALDQICRVTPGLRTVLVAEEGDSLRVVGQAGTFPHAPTRLRRTPLAAALAAAAADGEPTRCPAPPELVPSAGPGSTWTAMRLPDVPGQHMLVDRVATAGDETLVVVRMVLNQVALAIRATSAHRELEVQARTDGLTGLANRSTFSAALQAAAPTATGSRWVLFVDLDDFKVVNDRLGHAAGDELLRTVATRLVGTVRAPDLCARLGGDEFAVLVHVEDAAEAALLGRRLVDVASAPVRVADGTAQVGASVGAARITPGTPWTETLQRADVAMYAAKAAGKNRVQLFHPGLLEPDGTAAFDADLRAAGDRGQLVLAYQPIVSVLDGGCTAVEALVRWDHPVRGLLPPAAFLDAAERTGAIVPIGEHVLRRACADARRWAEAGTPVPVHVNASATQLAHPRFLDAVQSSLALEQLPPELLVIEITESTVLDSPAVQATLDELVHRGVGLALDDFGTGYSSLTTLRTLPIDTVKIDKSFVAGAPAQAADQAVVEAVVLMAERLGLTTVAEGVETPEQQQYLQDAGVRAVQGYLHLHPVPAAELGDWLGAPAHPPAALPVG